MPYYDRHALHYMEDMIVIAKKMTVFSIVWYEWSKLLSFNDFHLWSFSNFLLALSSLSVIML